METNRNPRAISLIIKGISRKDVKPFLSVEKEKACLSKDDYS
jgi:hypothetical protein